MGEWCDIQKEMFTKCCQSPGHLSSLLPRDKKESFSKFACLHEVSRGGPNCPPIFVMMVISTFQLYTCQLIKKVNKILIKTWEFHCLKYLRMSKYTKTCLNNQFKMEWWWFLHFNFSRANLLKKVNKIFINVGFFQEKQLKPRY